MCGSGLWTLREYEMMRGTIFGTRLKLQVCFATLNRLSLCVLYVMASQSSKEAPTDGLIKVHMTLPQGIPISEIRGIELSVNQTDSNGMSKRLKTVHSMNETST